MAIIHSEPLTVEKLKEAINDFDLIIRPKALILSPEMKEALLEAEPDIEKKLVLVVSPCVYDTAYLVDRKELEEFSRYTIESEDQN